MADEQQLTTQQQLQLLATELVPSCPDMRQLAREAAQSILEKYDQGHLDPDQVYLNCFHTAQSSPRTFSGWQHYETPYQSLTLPQLVMQRFDVSLQDNADLLGYLAGFYTQGANQNVFDERNEVPIAPADVLKDFWNIDFSRNFNDRLDQFWKTHAADYRLLAKTNFIAKVMEICTDDGKSTLAKRALEVLLALTGITEWPPTLETLEQEVVPAQGYQLRSFDIGGYIASDFLRIELEDGSQLLYTPGETEALHLFNNRDELYWWVLIHCNRADNRAQFTSHFALSYNAEKDSDVGLNHLIDVLFYSWGGDDHHTLNHVERPLTGDAFSYLRDAAHQRMIDDAQFSLRSNADLRKQLWIGYLGAFGQISGAMAAVDWPIALAAVGAGLAETGLNIDRAVNGHTTAERKSGITGAIFAAINTLFNAAMLSSAFGASAEIAQAEKLGEVEATHTSNSSKKPPEKNTGPASDKETTGPADEEQNPTEAELQTWVPKHVQPQPVSELLAPFETNVVLADEPGSGMFEGIYTHEGQYYALIDDLPYRVRFVGELRTWVVIDPENPFSFTKNVPIKMNAEGRWQPMARMGLKGGVLPKKLLAVFGRPTPRPALPPLEPSPYDVPAEMREQFIEVGERSIKNIASGDYFASSSKLQAVAAKFKELRNNLVRDAQQYIELTELPPRPELPELPQQASPRQMFRSLYEKSNGLVIGETHASVGSKRLLIDNMAELKKQKVKVLYLEHFTTDFQQASLDEFNRTGNMPADLERFVTGQDIGHGTDPTRHYTFKNVLLEAQKNGIRVQSIDCYVSYHQYWRKAPSAVIRQQMMNYYAHLVIEADQSARGAGKWIALMGNTHANLFEGVPGVSEMQGAIGMRVEEVRIGEPGGIGPDPGFWGIQDGDFLCRVKSDLRLKAPQASYEPTVENFEPLLERPGQFTITIKDGEPNLVHRNRVNELIYTPIHADGVNLYIIRPGWGGVSGKRYANLRELINGLIISNMVFVKTAEYL